jgi:hypothetical protein
MAQTSIYTYQIKKGAVAAPLFENCETISLIFDTHSVEAKYNEVERVLCLYFGDIEFFSTKYESLTLSLKDLESFEGVIRIRTTSKLDLPVVEDTTFTDYSKTVSILEEKKKLKTRSSTYVLASDQRQFSIDGDRWYEVDCLGTSLCKDITQEVLDLFAGL